MKRKQGTLSFGSSLPATESEAHLENECPSPAKGGAPPAAAPEKVEEAAVGEEGPAAAGPSGSRPTADCAAPAAKPRQQSWLKPQAPAVAKARLAGATGLSATRDLSRDELLQFHCEVVSNVLPAALAEAVLVQQLQESKDWQCESWNFGGKLAALHHAGCKYVFTVRRQRAAAALDQAAGGWQLMALSFAALAPRRMGPPWSWTLPSPRSRRRPIC